MKYKGFEFYSINSVQTYKLKRWIDSLGDNPVEIPDASQDGQDAWQADFDFSGILYLRLPSSVERIGKCAFAQSKIVVLEAPSVKEVDELAFYNTKELDRVDLSGCVSLGQDAFNHSAAYRIEIENVKDVGRYAFYDMPRLVDLSLPSLETMQSHSVYGCPVLTTLNLGKVEKAPSSAVSFCPELKSLYAPYLKERTEASFHNNGAQVTPGTNVKVVPAEEQSAPVAIKEKKNIVSFSHDGFQFSFDQDDPYFADHNINAEAYAVSVFIDTINKSGKGAIPSSPYAAVNESGHEALAHIFSIYIPEHIHAIGDYAFAKCYGLNTVVAPGVEYVGDHAFYCDEALGVVNMPSLKEIEHDAFNGAGANTMLVANFPEVERVGTHAFWQSGIHTLDIPKATLEPAAFEENGGLKEITIKETIDNTSLINNPRLEKVLTGGKKELHDFLDCPNTSGISEVKKD